MLHMTYYNNGKNISFSTFKLCHKFIILYLLSIHFANANEFWPFFLKLSKYKYSKTWLI
jgi:hypothetical protein